MVSSTLNTTLNGISASNNYPPQNGLAVGPAIPATSTTAAIASYAVTAESDKLEWTNLSTSVTSSPVNLWDASLFGSAVTSVYDTRLAYDSSTGNYVLSAVVLSDGNYSIGFAITQDPSTGWTVATLPVAPSILGTPSTPDMPDISVGDGNIYVTTAQDSPSLVGTAQWIVSESSVAAAAGGTVTPLVSASDPGADGIMRSVTAPSGTTYYFGAYSDGASVKLSYQTYDSVSDFSPVQPLSPGEPNIGSGTIGNFAAPQPGTGTPSLDALDSRIQNLAYGTINGKNVVFGVSEVQVTSTSQPTVEWFEYDVSTPSSPQFVAGGELDSTALGLGAGVAIFNPSIAINGAGDVLINFTASSTTMFPSDYYVVAGPSGSFGAATLYNTGAEASNASFLSELGVTGLQRWGNYSSATADPNNPNGFWISNEFVSSNPAVVSIPTGLNAWWGTVTAEVTVNNATAPTVAFTTLAEASNQPSQTIAGTVTTGGAALVVGQTVTLTDNGVALTTSAPIIVQAGGAFSANVTLPYQGANSIVASVTDSLGNVGASAAVVDTLDNIAPAVAFTTVAETSNQPNQTLIGAVTLAAGAAATVVGEAVTLTDNGVALTTSAPIIVQAGGTFSANVTLPYQGANSIVASVTDSYGNTGVSAAVVDTLDNIAPTVAFTTVAETSNQANQTLIGAVTLAAGAAATVVGETVTFTDNGVALLPTGPVTVASGGGFAASFVLPYQGANSIVASVTDSLGNVGASAAVVDTLDNIAPAVAFTTVAETSNQANQTLIGADPNSGRGLRRRDRRRRGRDFDRQRRRLDDLRPDHCAGGLDGTFQRQRDFALPGRQQHRRLRHRQLRQHRRQRRRGRHARQYRADGGLQFHCGGNQQPGEPDAHWRGELWPRAAAATVVGEAVTLTDNGVALTTSCPDHWCRRAARSAPT